MLFVVPTPIGNLEDITLRAIRVLNDVDLIACEDTRTSRKLLARYEIKTPTTSFHEHNARTKAQRLTERMLVGEDIALISDAGTPGISDPGFALIRSCIEAEIAIDIMPGATALVPALLLSGLATHRFVFEGFLPVKKGRAKRLEALVHEDRTVILYESPHRLLRTLRDLEERLGDERPISVSRELTKKFEETVRGSISDVKRSFEDRDKIRGEFVIVISGK